MEAILPSDSHFDGRFHQPGEAGLLSALVQSRSSSESARQRSSSSSESALQRSSSSSELGDPGCLSFEQRCAMSLVKSSQPVPPPPAPARRITPYTKKTFILNAHPCAVLEKSIRLAKVALEHYNRRKKIKFELMDVMPVCMMPESFRLYTHINFTARSSKEGSKEHLFFAELYYCGKRRAPSGFVVTCCEPLGSDSTVGHKGFQVDGSVVRKNVDFKRCFGCTPRMLHPAQGEKYIAGHCNIPYIYRSPY